MRLLTVDGAGLSRPGLGLLERAAAGILSVVALAVVLAVATAISSRQPPPARNPVPVVVSEAPTPLPAAEAPAAEETGGGVLAGLAAVTVGEPVTRWSLAVGASGRMEKAAPGPTTRPAVRARPPVVTAAPVPQVPRVVVEQPSADEVVDVEPSPSASPAGTVLLGRVKRPSQGGTVSPAGLAVHLVEIGTKAPRSASTDAEGRFQFTGLEPGRLYYVVAVHSHRYPDGSVGWDYQYGWKGNGYGYVLQPVPGSTDSNLSWHLAITPPTHGRFAIELTERNADPEFCADLEPTNDPIARTPFRSWRAGQLEEAQ